MVRLNKTNDLPCLLDPSMFPPKALRDRVPELCALVSILPTWHLPSRWSQKSTQWNLLLSPPDSSMCPGYFWTSHVSAQFLDIIYVIPVSGHVSAQFNRALPKHNEWAHPCELCGNSTILLIVAYHLSPLQEDNQEEMIYLWVRICVSSHASVTSQKSLTAWRS